MAVQICFTYLVQPPVILNKSVTFDAIGGTHVDTYATTRTKVFIDDSNVILLTNGLYRTFRLTGAAVDAVSAYDAIRHYIPPFFTPNYHYMEKCQGLSMGLFQLNTDIPSLNTAV